MSQVQKYSWLIDTIHRAGEITFKEINRKWIKTDLSRGEEINRQTFYRWRNDILDMFGIIIECRLKGGHKYYIENPEVLEEGVFSKWLMDSFSTVNAISESMAIKERILVEDVPSSHNYLQEILVAMRENRVVEFTYKSFNSNVSNTFPIEPYCVKMFQKRWYLLAHSIYDNRIRLYGVDRIENIAITEETFNLPDNFNAQEYFSSYFGVVLMSDIGEEKIILRANEYHQHYMRSLPLHHTQREIFTCNEYADFELHLRPSYDFCMELLKYGGMIEVLEPKSLRHQMHGWAYDLWEMYKSD